MLINVIFVISFVINLCDICDLCCSRCIYFRFYVTLFWYYVKYFIHFIHVTILMFFSCFAGYFSGFFLSRFPRVPLVSGLGACSIFMTLVYHLFSPPPSVSWASSVALPSPLCCCDITLCCVRTRSPVENILSYAYLLHEVKQGKPSGEIMITIIRSRTVFFNLLFLHYTLDRDYFASDHNFYFVYTFARFFAQANNSRTVCLSGAVLAT